MKGPQRPKRIAHLIVLLALGASLLVNLPGGRASIVATQRAHAVMPSSRVPGAAAEHLPDQTARGAASAALRASYAQLPLRFELNEGQTDPRVRFLAHGGGSTIFLTNTEAVIAVARGTASQSRALTRPRAGSRVRAHVIGPPDRGLMTRGPMHEDIVRLGYVGANPHPRVVGLDRLPGVSNYFIGNERTKWRTNVPGYARVELRDVYPGIDLVYYGRNGQLEYDWVLRPGADPRHIQLAVDGTTQVRIDAQGNAILQSGGVRMRQAKPVIYQEIGGRKRLVSGHYVLAVHRQIGMAVGAYNARARLVIDPVLVYSTYFGGGFEEGNGIAVDRAGAAYVTGDTSSVNFPIAHALQPRYGGNTDAFVVKLTPAGNALVYSTYLGGRGDDGGSRIAVDGVGAAYVTGRTSSTDFPTVHALQPRYSGSQDAFVAKLTPVGNALVYSTYLGGSGDDYGSGIAVDRAGAAYVTGTTASTNFPTAHALQSRYGGGDYFDAFVAKLTPAGNALVYATYLGGSGDDVGHGIAVDGAGAAYVTGETSSVNFPTTANALQPRFGGGSQDAFVTKLTPAGGGLVYSTYLGGDGSDRGHGIAVDRAGAAYVTGDTSSVNFPTAHALQPRLDGGPEDAFVVRLTPVGNALAYATYLGGDNNDHGYGIAVDGAGAAYVTGITASTNFPTAHALRPRYGGTYDAFVAKISPPMPTPHTARHVAVVLIPGVLAHTGDQ